MNDIEVLPVIQDHDETWWFILDPLSAAGRAWIEDDLPAWAEVHLPVSDERYDQHGSLIIKFAYMEAVLTAIVADGLTAGVGQSFEVSIEQ